MKTGIRWNLVLLLTSYCMFCSASPAPAPAEIPAGHYSYTQQGDELTDGQKASISWHITIKDDGTAVVAISSWHAPFTCEGLYHWSDEPGYRALSWSVNENTGTECDSPSPQIRLRQENGKIFIHSELFPWDPQGWKHIPVTRR